MKVMKKWLYIAMVVSLFGGTTSCSDDDDDTSELEEQLKQKEETIKQLEEANKKLEEEKKSLDETNKQLKETNKKLDEVLSKIEENGSQGADTTTVNLSGKKYENPGWTSVETEGDYAYTMTVVFELPATLKSVATENDLMAAFVGDECRSVEKIIDGVYLLTIIGTGEEEEDVTFRYWNAGNHYMYESTIRLPFTSDLIYGVVDSPKKFTCTQM